MACPEATRRVGASEIPAIGPPCVASSLDDEVDLDAGPKCLRGSRDRRANGKGLTDTFCVDAIHRGEVSHVREKHTGAHDIIKTLAGRFQNRP
jgi:hypothetical protein